jgi:glycosyltransferase involved in cell wall biosynthesis
MTKVAIVCGGGIVSGKEIMALELAKGLRDIGCEVEVVTSFWGNGEFLRRLQDENLPAHIMRLGFISATLNRECLRMTAHQMLFWPGLLLTYKRFLNKVRPAKIVHTNWQHALLLWPFLNCKRDIYWSHEVFADKPQYRRIFCALANRISCFVAVSKVAAQSLLKLGIPSNKVVVIYNGIADSAAGQVGKSENSPPVIGIVGQIGSWKGHEDLIMAFRTVLTSQPSAQLHVFGRPGSEYEAFLRKRACELRMDSSVIWRGFVEESSQIYRELSIVAVPSRYAEPFGLTAIEAGFFGVPVVASRKGGLPEIITDGVTGLLFESGDAGELAQHLAHLLADAELRQKMGREARKRAISVFGRNRFVREFCEILELKSSNVAATSSIE